MGMRALVYSLKRSDDDRNCLMAEISGMRIRNGRLEVSYGDMSPTALSCRDAKRRIRAKKYASGTQTGYGEEADPRHDRKNSARRGGEREG